VVLGRSLWGAIRSHHPMPFIELRIGRSLLTESFCATRSTGWRGF
jgi:predicted N-acyltransferase